MRRRRGTAIAVFAAALVLAGQALAGADPIPASPKAVAGGTPLSVSHPVLRFSGAFTNPTPLPAISDPDPTVCAFDCQEWTLNVATTESFLVSIKNKNGSIDDGLNLYVDDPSGQQVGSSEGVGSNGQSVAVKPATKGAYTIQVTVTYQYDPKVVYLGEARIMAPPSWKTPSCASPCPLLPSLYPQPPTDFHVDGIPPVASTPLGFPFPFSIPTGNSCYVDETAGTGATRCLRFTSSVENDGAGILHLRVQWIGQSGSAFVPGQCTAQQIVEWSNGKTTDRPAGPCEFHLEHAHFHYRNFVSFGLYGVNADGSRGSLVGRSLKESFCLADDDYFGFGTAGPNGPRNYAGQPGCSFPSTFDQSGASIDMGVSPGWADVYTWDTPSQYIDISNVKSGVYDVVSETNPAGDLLLAGPAHVCSSSRIRLTDGSVKMLGQEASVPCP
jgi:Lysyl oxidase